VGGHRSSLLGGRMMSQRSVCPQGADIVDGKQRFMGLLNQALDLADALELPPEIGARLQEIIDLAGHQPESGEALH
jgi:hypothetical protein